MVDLVALNGKQQVQQCLQQANRRGCIMGVGENGSVQPIPPPFLFACYKLLNLLHSYTMQPILLRNLLFFDYPEDRDSKLI
jgi:hypothetical protein